MANEQFNEKNVFIKNIESDSVMSVIKKYSFAKTNRYFVNFELKSGLLTYIKTRDSKFTDERIKEIKFNCTAVSTPQRNFSISNSNNSGHECTIPTNYNLQTITISFNCSADMKEKLLFEYWMEYIYDQYTRRFNFFDEYCSDVFKIIQIDAKNEPTYGMILKKVYPLSIQSIALDHQPTSMPIRIDINLAFMYIESFDY